MSYQPLTAEELLRMRAGLVSRDVATRAAQEIEDLRRTVDTFVEASIDRATWVSVESPAVARTCRCCGEPWDNR